VPFLKNVVPGECLTGISQYLQFEQFVTHGSVAVLACVLILFRALHVNQKCSPVLSRVVAKHFGHLKYFKNKWYDATNMFIIFCRRKRHFALYF